MYNDGATELDVSMMITALKSGDLEGARKDLCEMVSAAGGRAKIKAIYEQGLLTDDEKQRALGIAVQCGVEFIRYRTHLPARRHAPRT